jgi:hypothetical protein
MEEGFELEVTFKLKYKANPKNYDTDDPYLMARIDAEAFADDPDAAFSRFAESDETEITVAPVVRYEPERY